MNNNFILDDGVRTFTFSNNTGEVFAEFSFNPADTAIAGRYAAVMDFFGGYDFSLDDKEDVIAAVDKIDNDIKEQFNVLFGKDVSSTLFRTYNPCAVFPDGDFFCEKVIEIIGTVIEEEMKVRIENKKAKIKKATEKYRK